MNMDKFKDKKIAVLGFGIEGKSVADFLTDSEITVFDEKNREDFDPEVLNKYENGGVKFELGRIGDLTGFSTIFRSPGFHPKLPKLVAAQENGIEISSATKLFFDLCP